MFQEEDEREIVACAQQTQNKNKNNKKKSIVFGYNTFLTTSLKANANLKTAEKEMKSITKEEK